MSPAESRAASVTARTALASAVDRLRDAGSPSARLDAEVLVSHAFGRERAWLLAHLDEPMPEAAGAELARWIERRAGGEPIAYIRGFKEWYGLRVATDQRALIPRPETELLVDAAIAEVAARLARDDRPIHVAEVGTGSGAVAVALARRFHAALALGRVRLVASDVSPEAMELASDNLVGHGVQHLVTVAVGDLLEPVAPGAPPPDVIVANLPYLRTAEVVAGAGSLAFEPAEALDGGPDGLALIRRLLSLLPERLAMDGAALFEIGEDQAEPIRLTVAALPGRWAVATTRDLAGDERIARIQRLG